MMKSILTLLAVALLSGCANHHAPTVEVRPRPAPATTLPNEGIESVRYAENLKAYPLSRYIDPNNRRLMHEAHTIYRVETTPRWNLHSEQPASIERGPAMRSPDRMSIAAPERDELIVELNRQKEATRAVLQGTQVVSQRLNQLGESMQQTKQVAAENVVLKRQADATQQRLDALESELRRQKLPKAPPASADPSEKPDW